VIEITLPSQAFARALLFGLPRGVWGDDAWGWAAAGVWRVGTVNNLSQSPAGAFVNV